MELNFIKCGDYYIPDIKLKNPNIRLGKWGRIQHENGKHHLCYRRSFQQGKQGHLRGQDEAVNA